MRIHFSRNDSGETEVQLVEKENRLPFSYITLVKHLIDNASLEETSFGEGFSNEEKSAVNSMVQNLEQACSKRTKTV